MDANGRRKICVYSRSFAVSSFSSVVIELKVMFLFSSKFNASI